MSVALSALALAATIRASPTSSAGAGDILAAHARCAQISGQTRQAETLWRRVLRTRTSDPEALAALAGLLAHDGRREEARGIIRRLDRAANAPRGATAALEASLEAAPSWNARRDHARALARAGATGPAAEAYRALAGDRPPAELALEYWETLAGTRNGWEPAREALASLSEEGCHRVMLSYARVLTFRPSTRDEGVRRLEELVRIDAVSAEAATALRQARAWTPSSPEATARGTTHGRPRARRAVPPRSDASAEIESELAGIIGESSPDQTLRRRRLGVLAGRARAWPQVLSSIGLALSDAGDHDGALALIVEARSITAHPSAALLLRHGAVLDRLGRDEALAAVLVELSATAGTLSESELAGAAALQRSMRMRRAIAEPGLDGRAWRELVATYPEDDDVACAAGRWALEHDAPAEASLHAQRVLARRPSSEEGRRIAVEAAIATGQLADAVHIADAGAAMQPSSSRLLILAARTAELAGDLDRASRHLDAVDRLEAKPGSVESADREALRRRLEHATELRIRIMPAYRTRSGEAGLSALDESSWPLEIDYPLGPRTRVALGAEVVTLSAGTPTTGGTRPIFGSGPTAAPAQAAIGAAVRASVVHRSLRVELGCTPIGFSRVAFAGEVSWKGQAGVLGLELSARRSLVRDSVLSAAGAADPASGRTWGSVVRDALHTAVTWSPRPWDWHAFAAASRLTGIGVEPNTALLLGATSLRKWTLPAGVSISAGLAASAEAYARNDYAFTVGNGGYFSPGPLAHVGARLELRWGDLSLSVEPGANALRQSSRPLFPLDPSLQQQAEALLDGGTVPARMRAGFALDAGAGASFEIAPDLGATVRVAHRRAPQYFETTVNLSLEAHLSLHAKPPR